MRVRVRQARGDGGAGAGARRRVARLGAQEREERELAQAIQASLKADARSAPAPAAAAARPMALPKRQSRAPTREDFVDITMPGLSLASPKGGRRSIERFAKIVRLGAEKSWFRGRFAWERPE